VQHPKLFITEMSTNNLNSAPTSSSCNQVGCSACQTEFVPVTILLVPTFHRHVTLHMASGDLATDLSEVRISPYENRLHWICYSLISWSFQILWTINLRIIAL